MAGDPTRGDAFGGDSGPGDAPGGDSIPGDASSGDSNVGDPDFGDPTVGDPRGGDGSTGDPRPGDALIGDGTGPLELQITSPTAEGLYDTTAPMPTVAGTCSPSVVSLRTNEGAVDDADCSDGIWSLAPLPLHGGLTRVEVTAVGIGGNELTAVLSIVYTPPPEPKVGQHHLGVILMDYANDGTSQTVAEIQTGLFDGAAAIAAYVAEASYGTLTLTGDIFGWYLPAVPLTGTGFTNCFPMDSDALAEAAGDATLADYDGFLIVVNDVDKGAACPPGNSTFGPVPLSSPQGELSASMSRSRVPFYFPYDYTRTHQSTVAHELTHSFGARYHSNSYLCGTLPLSIDPNDCVIGPYGDLFAMMGLRSQASHPNSITKERLGWLHPDRVQLVTTSGDFLLDPFEAPSVGTQVLKIPLPNRLTVATADGSNRLRTDFIYVEYRGMTGFDYRSAFFRNIRQTDGSSDAITDVHGALLRIADCSANDFCVPQLLDMHPASMVPAYPPDEAADAYLWQGELFPVPGNPIEIEVIDVVAGDHITVRVTYL